MNLRQYISFLIIISFVYTPMYAQDITKGFSLKGDLTGSGVSEYYAGEEKDGLLITVNLWGGVTKPGIYHIPVNTNLTTLLSYAGGPSKRAKLDEVLVKRELKGRRSKLNVDLDKIINNPAARSPQIEPNDIVVIPESKPLVSSDTALLVGVISGIASIILASFVIADQASD